jgi:hypothetical protein
MSLAFSLIPSVSWLWLDRVCSLLPLIKARASRSLLDPIPSRTPQLMRAVGVGLGHQQVAPTLSSDFCSWARRFPNRCSTMQTGSSVSPNLLLIYTVCCGHSNKFIYLFFNEEAVSVSFRDRRPPSPKLETCWLPSLYQITSLAL